MENRIVYITGGTKGIGFGVAEVLLKNGFSVAISGRKKEDVDKAAAALGNPEKVLGLQSDVRNLEDEQAAVKAIVAKFGKLDAVIANAGLGVFKPIDELSTKEWNSMIETNLTGCFYTL